MHQMYIGFCVILSLVHGCSAHIYKEEDRVQVYCDPGLSGTMIFWFRISDDGAKFLFTVRNKELKAQETEHKVNVNDKASLTIESFKKKTDSGVYTCAVINNNKLIFGKPTVVEGKPDPTTQPPKIITTPKPVLPTTTKPQCNGPCKKTGAFESKTRLNCETWILSSLASGCALLLILLIVTILYCNRLRTRRCPHHYKRQPQTRPAGHAKLPNNHF